MIETLVGVLSWAAGAALGATFFGGLWWTVQKGVAAKQPGLLFLGSLLLRISMVMVGFYFVAAGHWERMLLCLLGFVMAQGAATGWARWRERQVPVKEGASHAS